MGCYKLHIIEIEYTPLKVVYRRVDTEPKVVQMWYQVDPKAEAMMGMSPYCAMGNNPVLHTDPNGDILPAILIGAAIGGYSGYKLGKANGASGWGLVGYTLGAAAIGGLSGGVGSAISTSGIAFANTLSIVGASATNSLGMRALSGGQIDFSVSFGFGSYNFNTGDFGYLGKSGNSELENFGYAMGAIANFNDAMVGFKSKQIGEVELVTERSDHIGHSALVEPGVQTNNSIVSFGPTKGISLLQPDGGPGDSAWPNHITDKTPKIWRTKIIGINKTKILDYGQNLSNNTPNYNLYTSSCVTHTSLALIKSGFFNIGIHPYILHAQVALSNFGIRSHLFTTHLINP